MLPGRIIKKLQNEEEGLKGRRVQFPANVEIGGFYTRRTLAGTIVAFGSYGQVHVKGDNGLSYAVQSDLVELL